MQVTDIDLIACTCNSCLYDIMDINERVNHILNEQLKEHKSQVLCFDSLEIVAACDLTIC